jgi:hypothetical protein
MNDFCPDDAICPDDPTCMECGNICKKSEIVWTGDQNSYKGWELWCYCDRCKIDTFHKMISVDEYLKNEK